MAKKKQMLLIINPRSGREKIRLKLLDILDAYTGAGYQIQVYVTQKSLDARDAVLKYGGKKDLIVCSGGDGTLNEVISGMMELTKPVALGYIPAGSTNDFASSLKLPKQMMPAALNAVNGIPRAVDIGRFCEDSYFAYVAGFGAFTEVSYMTPQDKKNLLGHQAYILEGVKSLASIKSYVMKVTSPAETIEGEFIYGMVTNTVSVGGFKGLINQNVSLSDGLFEVLLIRMPKTPLEFSSIVTGLLMREEETSDLIYKFKASELHIEAQEPVDWVLDGEFGGSKTAVSIRNLPRQIEILCPEPGKERKYAV